MRLWTKAVILAAISIAMGCDAFVCQKTIDTYNEFVNVGNFQAAANLTFTDDVRYVIPGPVSLCPYCNTYNGKQAVISLFVDGFLGHFTIAVPLVNLRQVDTGNDTASPRLMNFNQESFVTNPAKTQGGIGRYFSVPVIHDFTFDPSTCLINQMILFQDPYTVVRVFAGHPAVAAPVMPFVVFASPPNEFASTQAVTDFQVFPQEADVNGTEAKQMVVQFYALLDQNDGNITTAEAEKMFVPLNYSLPQTQAALIVPGDPSVLPFAGMFLGVDQVVQGIQLRRKSLAADPSPLRVNASWIVQGGSVAVQYRWHAVTAGTPQRIDCEAVDYFQITNTANGLRIGRLTQFFDTYNVTMAILAS
jgi:hypothetical protein